MKIRDRIVELVRVKASELVPSEKNWRIHNDEQRAALRGIFAEVGIANAVLARRLEDGRLALIDGHMRSEEIGKGLVPVLVLDVNEQEADLLLASLDPLASMATQDQDALASLLNSVQADDEALQAMLNGLAPPEPEETELRQVDVKPPPKMAWVLVGIPLVRFGEINAEVEKLAAIPGVVLEMTVNDNEPETDADG